MTEDKELAALRERIDNAAQASAETQPDWKHRCFRIMSALGFDYGDPDWVMPDERKRIDAALARAETAERERDTAITDGNDRIEDLHREADELMRERDRIADELDTMNNNHRVMAKLLADTGRERDEAREALRNILDECDEAPTDNSAWVVAIQNIARAITGEKP